MFIGRTDAEPKAPVPWPPNKECQPIGRDSDARKNAGGMVKG